MRLTVVLTLTFSLVACDDDGDVTPPPVVVAEGVSGETPLEGEANPAETEPAVETPPAEPEDHFVLGPCTASETYGLGNLQDRRGSTGVAFDSVRGGLVIRTKDLDHVEAWRLAASGAPAAESVEVELPGARDIKGLYRVGERFLAVTHTLCADTRHMQKCLHLRALEADGTPAGEVLTHSTSEWIEKGFFVETDAGLLVLRSHTYIQPVFERYAINADGSVARSEVADVTHENEDGAGPRAVALTSDGDRWAALIANDLEATRYFLHSSEAPEGVRLSLPVLNVAVVTELTFVDEGLRLVLVRTGRSPRLAIVRLDGSVVEAPRELPVDESLPDNRIVTVTAGRRDEVTFARYDLARRPIAGDVELPFNGMVSVDGDGLRWVLAFEGGTSRRASTGRDHTREGSVTTIDCARR